MNLNLEYLRNLGNRSYRIGKKRVRVGMRVAVSNSSICFLLDTIKLLDLTCAAHLRSNFKWKCTRTK